VTIKPHFARDSTPFVCLGLTWAIARTRSATPQLTRACVQIQAEVETPVVATRASRASASVGGLRFWLAQPDS
jgi:hypothetical protein